MEGYRSPSIALIGPGKFSEIGKNKYLCSRIFVSTIYPNIHHSLFPAVKRGNLKGKQAGRLNFVHNLCGVRSDCFRVFHDLTAADCSPYIFEDILLPLLPQQGYAHILAACSKGIETAKFDWETGGTGRTSCIYGTGFGCLFRGSLPCLIPFSRSPCFSLPLSEFHPLKHSELNIYRLK